MPWLQGRKVIVGQIPAEEAGRLFACDCCLCRGEHKVWCQGKMLDCFEHLALEVTCLKGLLWLWTQAV